MIGDELKVASGKSKHTFIDLPLYTKTRTLIFTPSVKLLYSKLSVPDKFILQLTPN